MSGINQSVVLDVCRLTALFVDDVGNRKLIRGTGFWMKHGPGSHVFVTNKHNVNPTIKLGSGATYSLRELKIELREFVGENPTFRTQFFEVDLGTSVVRTATLADSAVLLDPVFVGGTGAFRSGNVLATSDLADGAFLKDKVAIMDAASFIGFAGNKDSQWWDQLWRLGIARTVNIASVPGIPFTHADLKTSDVTLVAGLSFSGSSGSVVILHEKSLKVGDGLVNPHYVPPKVIGIMSGHWWDIGAEPGLFLHSGISYFTRSSSVLSLL